jgi:hypothetical protein
MLIWNKNLAVLSLILALLFPSPGLADDTKSSAGTPHMLLGGVTHSEELPPLPDQLKTGNVFNESSLRPASAIAPTPQTILQPRTPPRAVVMPPTQPVRTATPQVTSPVPSYKQPTTGAKQPMQLNAKTVKPNANQSQLAVKQLNAYLKQQAKLGNVGTAGLQNYTHRTQSTMQPHPATFPGKTLTASASTGQSITSSPPLKQLIKANIPVIRFQIPAWLAGRWSRTDSTELSRTELPSHKVLKATGKTTTRVTDSFGTYKDSKGIIWQIFDPTKTSGSIDRGANIDYHTVSSYDLQATTDKQVVVRLRATHVVVNKITRKIVMSYQDEELNSFNRIDATRLRTDSSTKVFNFKGKPTLLTTASSFENKTANP